MVCITVRGWGMYNANLGPHKDRTFPSRVGGEYSPDQFMATSLYIKLLSNPHLLYLLHTHKVKKPYHTS